MLILGHWCYFYFAIVHCIITWCYFYFAIVHCIITWGPWCQIKDPDAKKNDYVALFTLTELRQNNNSISFMTETFTSHIKEYFLWKLQETWSVIDHSVYPWVQSVDSPYFKTATSWHFIQVSKWQIKTKKTSWNLKIADFSRNCCRASSFAELCRASSRRTVRTWDIHHTHTCQRHFLSVKLCFCTDKPLTN